MIFLAAADFIEAKRKVILAAEEKIAHFEQLMVEKPRLKNLYNYWRSWYIVRRDDWITRSYIEQLRAWKQILHTWEQQDTLEQHLKEINVIAKNLTVIEDGLKVIELDLREILELAREHNWHVRYPKPQTTMEGWIAAIHQRYPVIKQWIVKIREELPSAWIDFVYVIYYAYTSPGMERHLEAHFESKCVNSERVKVKVKEMANKVLRAFVAAPRVVAGEVRPGYESPMLRAEMGKAPYEGRIVQGQNMWQWGVQWNAQINYNISDKRVVPSEAPTEIKALKAVPMILELFDYDYPEGVGQIRNYREVAAPAKWWTMTLTELLEFLGIEVER